MKKLILAIILPTVAMFSCEEGSTSMKIEKSLSRSREFIFDVNTAGNIGLVSTISSKKLIEELTDSEEFFTQDYTITALTFESLEVTLLPKTGNSASGLNTTTIIASENSFFEDTKLLNSEPIGMGEGNNELVNTHLLITGVETLNRFLKECIGNKGFNSYLAVQVSGNTVPINGKAVATLKLRMRFNLEYWYCQQSPVPLVLKFQDKECAL